MKRKTMSIFSATLKETISNHRNEFVKFPKTQFIRCRYLTLENLILLLINSHKESLKDELKNYFDYLNIDSPTSSALCHAKKKLQYSGFNILIRDLASKLLEANKKQISLFKNKYMLLAIDGSKVIVPTRIEGFEEFIECNHKGRAKTRQIMISELYDPLNNIPLSIACCKRNDEHVLARELVDEASKIVRNYRKIFVFDRYYPSWLNFYHIEKNESFYIMRLNKQHFKNLYNPIGESGESTIETKLEKSWYHMKKRDEALIKELSQKTFKLRFVWFPIAQNEREVIVTNLPEDVTLNEIKELYWYRWGEETDYRHSKQRTLIDVFSGRRQETIFQDIYSSFISHMLTCFMILECREKVKKKTENYKHEMKSSHANAVRQIRKSGILLLIYFNVKGRFKKEYKVYKDIINTVIPIRPGRFYMRSIIGTSKMDVYKY